MKNKIKFKWQKKIVNNFFQNENGRENNILFEIYKV